MAVALHAIEDRRLSPYTGWTREHWIEVTQRIIAGVLQYADRDRGWIVPPPNRLDEVVSERHVELVEKEMFERSLLAAAIYAAGTGRTHVDGFDGDIIEFYLRGIRRGTDPNDPCYWGPNKPYWEFGTTIAVAMLIHPAGLWEPLSRQQRERFCRWAEPILALPCWDNNHWYFRLGLSALFERVGWKHERDFMTSRLQRCLDWHRGNGWFIDGNNRAFDHYNFWGFALYNTFLYWADPAWREQFGERIKQITREFFEVAPLFFTRDGGPVAWGRSLAYRFGGLGAIGWGHLAGLCPLPAGQARRLASGALKFFWDGGCMNEQGLLSGGWTIENPALVEDYISVGAPYWTCHGLAPLMIGADDEFWTAEEQPNPADEPVDHVAALRGAGMTVRTFGRSGEVRVHFAGTPRHEDARWQVGAKYYQHTYSSAAGFAVAGAGKDLCAGRSGASLNGQQWVYRKQPDPILVEEDRVAGKWSLAELQMPEAWLVTHSLLGPSGELHILYHTASQPLQLMVAGYAVAVPHGEAGEENRLPGGVCVAGKAAVSALQKLAGPAGMTSVEHLAPSRNLQHSHLFGGVAFWPVWRSSDSVPAYQPVMVYTQTGPRASSPIEPPQVSRRGESAWSIQWAAKAWEVLIKGETVKVVRQSDAAARGD